MIVNGKDQIGKYSTPEQEGERTKPHKEGYGCGSLGQRGHEKLKPVIYSIGIGQNW